MLESLFGGFNLFDLIFLVFIVYFVYNSEDFISSLADLIGFIITIFISFSTYNFFAGLLVNHFSITRGIAQAIGFFVAWFVIESILFVLTRTLINRLPEELHAHKANKVMAYIPSLLQGTIFFMLITVTIFTLPVRALVKEEIVNSKTGPFFISFSQAMEGNIKKVFGEAVNETINFLTIQEGSSEGVSLGFKAPPDTQTVDELSEESMLNLVNKERHDHGLHPVFENTALREVARQYAREMMTNGFFSHYSEVDGSSPSDRVERNGISYQVTGENLAYAPDVYLAHQGLMNSPGHRRNILSEEYGEVGIGVIDGGIYGKMFVQVFKD